VQARAGKCGPPRVDAKAGAATYSPDR
jgi:hypothetical protein